MKDANELRCIAQGIILDLHKRKELGQLQLLLMVSSLAVKDLDREDWEETIQGWNHMIERSRSTGVE